MVNIDSEGEIIVVIRRNRYDLSLHREEDQYHGIDVNVAIAGWIPAGGRVYMDYLLNYSAHNVYYTSPRRYRLFCYR